MFDKQEEEYYKNMNIKYNTIKKDYPRYVVIFMLRILLTILVFVLIFPMNYIIYGWKRTWCSCYHNMILFSGTTIIHDNHYGIMTKKCKKCNLKYVSYYSDDGV